MTVSSTTSSVSYTGNGATTAFSFPYKFLLQADLRVVETVIATGVQTTKALTTDYTISGTTDATGAYPSGGTVTAVTAPASTVTWTIIDDPAITQLTVHTDNDPIPAASIDNPLDKLTIIAQRLSERIDRSLHQPDGDTAAIGTLPAKVARASMYLAFDANSDPIASPAPTGSVVSAFMATVLDDTTAAAARTTLGAQAQDADLDAIAALTQSRGRVPISDGSGWVYSDALTTPGGIINGEMALWQRGTSFAQSAAGTATYLADRWYQVNSAVGRTISRQASGVGGGFCARVARDNGVSTTNSVQIGQALESIDCNRYAGKTVTLSFDARSGANYSAATAIMASIIDAGQGTNQSATNEAAGTWTSQSVASQNNTLTTTWQRFYHQVTLGASVTQVGARFTFTPVGTAGAADYFELKDVRIDIGPAQPFIAPPFADTALRCRRYFRKYGGDSANVFRFQGYQASGFAALLFTLDVPMRVAPTATQVGTWTLTNVTGSLTIDTETACWSITWNPTATGASGFNCDTTAKYLTLDSEL